MSSARCRALAPHGVAMTHAAARLSRGAARASRRRAASHRWRRPARRAGAAAARRSSAAIRCWCSTRPALFARDGGPYADAAGRGLARQLAPLRRARPRRRRPRRAARSRAGASTSSTRTTGRRRWRPPICATRRPAPATPAVMTIHNIAFQGRFDADDLPRARPAARGLVDRRRRILRRRRLPEGRARSGRRDHHRQPDLCARDPRRPSSAWGWKA